MNRKVMFQVVVTVAALALCSMFAGIVSAQPVSEHVTLTGYISCTTCMVPNTCKAQTRASCTQWWINQGASYVLVVGDSHYRLSGFDKELTKASFANSVTVTGDLTDHDVVVTGVDIVHKVK